MDKEITIKEIFERIEALKLDERLGYEPANTLINAPLALIQASGMAELNALEWVLNQPRSTTKSIRQYQLLRNQTKVTDHEGA